MLAASFYLVTLLCLLLFYTGSGMDKKKRLPFVLWQFLVGGLAFFHVFENNPALFPVVILATLAWIFYLLQQANRQKLNRAALLSVHVLRIAVEYILFQLYQQKKIPRLMTFEGWNFDILIGLSAAAILVYELLRKKNLNRRLFIAWNILGLLFLLFIVCLAILSSPLPIQQLAFDQPNTAILTLPYCWLPACVVPLVFLSHILLIGHTKYPHPPQAE